MKIDINSFSRDLKKKKKEKEKESEMVLEWLNI